MKNFIFVILISLIAGFTLKFFSFEIFTVPTASMQPTIKQGAKVWLNKLNTFNFNKKDIVAFEKNGENFVKRIVAVPNDTVYSDGRRFQIYKTGTIAYKIPKKESTFIFNETNFDFYKPLLERFENVQAGFILNKIFINGIESNIYTFKNNYYFLQGDNTEGSLDSRDFGLIAEKNLLGKVLFYD